MEFSHFRIVSKMNILSAQTAGIIRGGFISSSFDKTGADKAGAALKDLSKASFVQEVCAVGLTVKGDAPFAGALSSFSTHLSKFMSALAGISSSMVSAICAISSMRRVVAPVAICTDSGHFAGTTTMATLTNRVIATATAKTSHHATRLYTYRWVGPFAVGEDF